MQQWSAFCAWPLAWICSICCWILPLENKLGYLFCRTHFTVTKENHLCFLLLCEIKQSASLLLCLSTSLLPPPPRDLGEMAQLLSLLSRHGIPLSRPNPVTSKWIAKLTLLKVCPRSQLEKEKPVMSRKWIYPAPPPRPCAFFVKERSHTSWSSASLIICKILNSCHFLCHLRQSLLLDTDTRY